MVVSLHFRPMSCIELRYMLRLAYWSHMVGSDNRSRNQFRLDDTDWYGPGRYQYPNRAQRLHRVHHRYVILVFSHGSLQLFAL